MVYVLPDKYLNGMLARHKTVQAQMKVSAEMVGKRADGLLAIAKADARIAHATGQFSHLPYDSGGHEIKVQKIRKHPRFGKIDYFVILQGRAAHALEFGHKSSDGKRWISGKFIMHRTYAML